MANAKVYETSIVPKGEMLEPVRNQEDSDCGPGPLTRLARLLRPDDRRNPANVNCQRTEKI